MRKILIISIFCLAFVSCSKDFLDKKPSASIATSVLNDPKYAPQVFNGAWRYLNDTYFTYANPGFSSIMRINDAMASDMVVMTGKYGYLATYQFTELHLDNIYRTRSMWTLLYKVIDQCNLAIKLAGDDADVANVKGQALALRAFMYFTLAQHYALTYVNNKDTKVVPIYLEPSNASTVPQPKSTVEKVYNQIEADLNNAETLLAGWNRKDEKFRPNLNVVYGLMARVALVKNDWANAEANAKKAYKGFPLMDTTEYVKGFNDVSNGEWLWGHPQTNDQSTASYSFHYMDLVSSQSYYYSFMCDPHFKKHFDANDVRTKMFEYVRDGYLAYKKFLFRPRLTQADIVYMRSSEMHLIEAEALAQQNKFTEAAVALNRVLSARMADTFDPAGKTKEEVLERIYLERRKELWGEGFGLSDLLRLQKPIVRNAWTDATLIPCRQIPSGEMKNFAIKGHHVTTFPAKAPFVANSPYMIFEISDTEKLANPNLNN